jgi:hypothetical protein
MTECGSGSGYSGYGSEGGYSLVDGKLVANHICSECGGSFDTSEALREHKNRVAVEE